MTEPTMCLSTWSLCSKWGFNDGNVPDALSDHWGAIGERVEWQCAVNWDAALRLLVRRHLVPAIEAAGHVVDVYDIDTIHNPIRAHTFDGAEVDHFEDWDGPNPTVTVTYAEIMAAIEETL